MRDRQSRQPKHNLPRTQLVSAEDTKEHQRFACLLSFLPHTSIHTDIKDKMAPHADSDKAGLAPNEPGLDEPSAAIQAGKFPK